MERMPVQSSNLSSIGYDSGSETLEIEFLNGSIYEYRNVPQVIYDALMKARHESCGYTISDNAKKFTPYGIKN